jgi:RNA polymerase sigma-32 factor
MTQALVTSKAQLPVAVGDLDAYIAAVYGVPVLAADEERALAERLRREQDLDAARELILHNLRFVVQVARGYLGYGLPLGDLVQEGNVGLMKAVKRFDPDVGVRLVSFAVHWIRAEIHEYILKNWRIVKVATTKAQRKLFFNLRAAKKRLGWLSADEVKTVADDLGVAPKTVLEMEARLSGHDIGFDPEPGADDHELHLAPASYLPSDGVDPATATEQADADRHHRFRLAQALEALDDRSRTIVERRWLSEGKATLQELADEYGVSAERIRQLEGNAIKRLRSAMAG